MGGKAVLLGSEVVREVICMREFKECVALSIEQLEELTIGEIKKLTEDYGKENIK